MASFQVANETSKKEVGLIYSFVQESDLTILQQLDVAPLKHDTNKAFVLEHQGSFVYEDRPLPNLRSSRDVIVRIVATGICGSDVSILANFQVCRIKTHEVV